MTDLPPPTTSRWQPLRLGLIDLFHYDDEQFWFRDGRLLLRGNNGTGKSKVLALTLPFLLDGSLSPRRVEPDADPKKRMEWNLLLGGAHPHSERLGYAWVEFGRLDAQGAELTLTLGCGLKAAAGRGIVRHWFFTTSQRVGADLRLVDDSGVVLARDRLGVALEGHGRLHDRQEEYRRSVDEQLFGLGERRYAALVDLLIQLRQPQLSKRPDERALSMALSESLAPLDQAVIADVAESFRALEEDREQLAEVEATHRAARDFLGHYRAYASVASRRAARGPREAQSHYEHLGRELIAVEAQVSEAEVRLRALAAAASQVEDQQADARAEDRALRAGPEMRSAEAIEAAVHQLAERRETEQTTADDATTARDAAASAHSAVTRLRIEHDADEKRASEQGQAALQASQPAGLRSQHDVALASDRDTDRVVKRRRDQVQVVLQLTVAADDAAQVATRSQEQVDRIDARVAGLHEVAGTAERHTDEAVELFGSAVHAYVDGLALLVLGDPFTVAQQARSWGHSIERACPVEHSVSTALTRVVQQITAELSGTQQSRDSVADELRQREVELGRLRAGRHQVPAPPPTRDPEARRDQPGAPLWQLVDFASDVAADSRAGIEAALEGAGILDAWVRPDGTVVGVRNGDVVLSVNDDTAPVEPNLAGVLVSAVDPEDDGARQVGAGVIAAVLSRIGLTDDSPAGVRVDVDGRFALGSAHGAWHTDRARFIGAGAREASRRERMAVLEQEIEQLVKQLEQLDGHVAELTARIGAAEAEARRYPRAEQETVTRAHVRAAATAEALATERQQLHVAHQNRDQAYRERDEHRTELVRTAQELAAPTTTAELHEVRQALGVYNGALQVLRERVTTAQRSLGALRDAESRLDRCESEREERARRADRARRETAAAAHHVDTLRQTVGQEVEALMRRLEALAARVSNLELRREDLRTQRETALQNKATAEGRAGELRRQRELAGGHRDEVVEVLRRFVETGLVAVALPDLDPPDTAAGWNVTAAISLARSIDAELGTVSTEDEVWDRVQQRVSRELSDLSDQMSRHGHSAVAVQREEGLGVRVQYHGEELDLPALDARLDSDLAVRRQLLSAKEREILENHLVTEVAGQLSDLLGRAQVQVDDLNRELATRRTSTGMQLRVQWRRRADAPEGLEVARGLLLRSDAAWTEVDRSSVGTFLQHEIKRVRAADPSASWTEHLEQALDYRGWHEFAIERHQQGQWQPATGPASGGERVLTVSIPLFAAASSHYNSAPNPHAPRLVLLDEAFAGVDDDARAKCLGMLATFDLDVVMTSEREWGCYPQVPGLAIAQLSRVEGIDAVHVTRWQWDGRDRSRAADPDRATWAGTTSQPPVDVGPSLFDGAPGDGD